MSGVIGIFNLDRAPVKIWLLEKTTRIQRHRGQRFSGYKVVAGTGKLVAAIIEACVGAGRSIACLGSDRAR